jgi:peptidoglycan hydrolase-like amidase
MFLERVHMMESLIIRENRNTFCHLEAIGQSPASCPVYLAVPSIFGIVKTPMTISWLGFLRPVAVFLLAAALFSPSITHAAEARKGFSARLVQAPTHVVMAPGEEKTLTVTFQNLGPNVWKNDGPWFISIYTYDPKYRESVFRAPAWNSKEQPVRLKEAMVAVGSVGTIELPLQAPEEVGTYTEAFHLAAEEAAWIPGGLFHITISVATPSTERLSSFSSNSSLPYAGSVTFLSAPKVKARGGATILQTVTVKNTGQKTWGPRELKIPEIQLASSAEFAEFFHKAWKSESVVLKRDPAVPPGGEDSFTFAFLAPLSKGTYTASFQLAVEGGETIEGAEINIPVEVTTDAGSVLTAPKRPYAEHISMEEPTIRVAVLIVDEETDNRVEVSANGAMNLTDTNGNVLAEVSPGVTVKAFYKNGHYYYDAGRGLEKSSFGIRFFPASLPGILTVSNFDRRVTRAASHASNTFRNILELRASETTGRVHLINELPIEDYLAGLAETSDDAHPEFQKALAVAARTYALYHWERYTKHDEEHFHVNAWSDQVYFGYEREEDNPLYAASARSVAGIVATYDGTVAITPYFSRSDGRTRDWSEVWGGEVAWAKSVSVPCDKGRTLWGHGVGMSASGALCMAKQDGKTFDEILKYFYTGIALEKWWEEKS